MRTNCKHQEGTLDQGGNALKWVMRGESPGRKSWIAQGRRSLKVGNNSWEQIIPARNSLAQFPGCSSSLSAYLIKCALLRAAFSGLPTKTASTSHCPLVLSSALFFSKAYRHHLTYCMWPLVSCLSVCHCQNTDSMRSGLGRLITSLGTQWAPSIAWSALSTEWGQKLQWIWLIR